ncbi:MAG: DEAD/DEAH box helicase [Candidatus Omnitrophica bacterium]|jgi:SNF2 family DNA or RNA helicase|nr:DEAD/DEAH box helicase [Candidatus Omnitrophota bacterium]
MRTAQLIKEGKIIKLTFPLERKLLEKLNTIAEIKMVKNDFWETPLTKNTVLLLSELNFVFSKALIEWKKENIFIQELENRKDINKSKAITQIKKLKLHHFQKECVKLIEKKQGRALIADEMGLGKTVEALSWVKTRYDTFPLLIICQAGLKENWQREIKKWLKMDSQILNGVIPYKIKSDIVVVNYDILHYWVQSLKNIDFNCIIADEAQSIKNNKARKTKAFKRITKDINYALALTGTPIENRPAEIYNIIHFIRPSLFPNFMDFAKEYCGAKKTWLGWDFSGATNTKKLNTILKNTIMIRRKKIDVLKDLPPKNIVNVYISIDNKIEYQKAEKTFITFLQEKFSSMSEGTKEELKQFAKRNKIKTNNELTDLEINKLTYLKLEKTLAVPVLAQLNILRQLAIKGKLNTIVKWIENFLESDEKLVVFCYHRKTLAYLMEKFPDAVKVEGGMTDKQKQKAVDSFQNDPKVRLFFGNIIAAGTGITLTAASNAAIIEYVYNPSQHIQAYDRIHRITQTKSVTIWRLIGINTIEEKIINITNRKEKIINNVIDGKKYKDKSTIMELVNSYLQINKNKEK